MKFQLKILFSTFPSKEGWKDAFSYQVFLNFHFFLQHYIYFGTDFQYLLHQNCILFIIIFKNKFS